MKVSARARLWLLPLFGLYLASVVGQMFLAPAGKCFVGAALGFLATIAIASMLLSSRPNLAARRKFVIGFLAIGTALVCDSVALLLMGNTWDAPHAHRPSGAIGTMVATSLVLISIGGGYLLRRCNSGS